MEGALMEAPGTGQNRSTEHDTALVKMVIDAQTRNKLWREFLCARRDELLARLRQQGYSPGAQQDAELSLPSPARTRAAGSSGPADPLPAHSPEATTRGAALSAEFLGPGSSPAADLQQTGSSVWWEEQDIESL
jgi:hypothetical protein